jgi:hypothetical protein
MPYRKVDEAREGNAVEKRVNENAVELFVPSPDARAT